MPKFFSVLISIPDRSDETLFIFILFFSIYYEANTEIRIMQNCRDSFKTTMKKFKRFEILSVSLGSENLKYKIEFRILKCKMNLSYEHFEC